jgi:hypothetical protein
MVNGVKVITKTSGYNYLEMTKNPKAKAYFDDGLWFWLGEEAKPKHVKFYVNTGTQEKETCDVRLTSIETLEKIGKMPTEWEEAMKAAAKKTKTKLSQKEQKEVEAI